LSGYARRAEHGCHAQHGQQRLPVGPTAADGDINAYAPSRATSQAGRAGAGRLILSENQQLAARSCAVLESCPAVEDCVFALPGAQ